MRPVVTGYLRGFYRYEVTVTTARWGTFVTPVWARTRADAIAKAKQHWGTTIAS